MRRMFKFNTIRTNKIIVFEARLRHNGNDSLSPITIEEEIVRYTRLLIEDISDI